MFIKNSILFHLFQLYYPGDYRGHLPNYGDHVANYQANQWQQPGQNYRSPEVANNGDGNVGDIQPEVEPIQSAGEAQNDFEAACA